MMSSKRSIFVFLKKDKSEKKYPDSNVVPKPIKFAALFRFSTKCEQFSLFIGTILAVVAGTGIPMINLVYGEFTNILVDRQYPTDKDSVETIILKWFGGGRILRNASREERMEALNEDALAFAGSVSLFASMALVSLGISVCIYNYVAVRQVNRIRIKLFKTLLSQSPTWFDVTGHINFTSKMTEELNNVQNGMGERLSIFIYQISVTVFILGSSLYMGWLLTLVLLGCLVPMLIVFLVLYQIQSSITEKEIVSVENASQVAEEVFTGIRTVYAFNGEERETQRYSEKLLALQSLGVTKGIASGFGVGFVWLVIYSCYAVAFSFGFRLILWLDEYTPADLITVFFAVLTAATIISYSGPYWESFATARGSAASIFRIINTKSDINPFSKDGISGDGCDGAIEFRNVHFHYPTRPETEILKGLNFKIRPGEKVAIVGGSGSGKSTVLQLIQRLYDPVVGDIFLDDVNLKSLNVSWLRRQLGVVLQEPVLFTTTINSNIAYGFPEASNEQIVQAAVKAHAHDFIMNLPDEYETAIDGESSSLSGGQRQRIAIARALLRKPKIFLLDEVTSALDYESDVLVRKSLAEVTVGSTTVTITHKISTLTTMDRIVVLADGVIAEEGTHDLLLKRNGIYSRLLKTEAENLKRVVNKSSEMERKADVSKGQVEESIKLLPGAKGSYFSDFGSREEVPKKFEDRYLNVNCCQFLQWNKSHWPFLYFGIFASIILGIILPLVCILFGELVGLLAIIQDETVYKVDIYSLILVLIGLAAGLFSFIQMCFLGVASVRLTTYLKLKTFGTIIRQEIAWFDSSRNSVSTLCARLNDDCSTIQGVIGGRVGVVFQGLTAMLLGVFISLYYSWKMTLVTILVVPFIFAGIFLDLSLSGMQRKKEVEVVENSAKIAVEAIRHIKVVNSLGIELLFLTQFTALLRKDGKCRKLGLSLLRGLAYSMGQTMMFFGYGISLWFGSYLIQHENLHYKEVIRVSELLIYGCWVLGQALTLAPNFKNAKQAAGRLQYLFLRRPKIRSGTIAIPPLMGNNDIIEFSNVYFSYPTRPNTVVLKNINFTIREGESVAFVGPSGSGKSTIIHLLLRFYDPNVGYVSVGNIRLSSCQLASLRQCMALVSQEPVLFDRTVYENIAYGATVKDVQLDDVIAAAKAANIHSFIASLPSGYNTKLGPSSGSHLSGGQKQKLAIARALIRNPKILLLDEATSALDPESEKTIQETLDNAMFGRTTITVAHRLGAIANADTIYVMVGGRIVESGSHAKLMRLKGTYFKMREDLN